MVRVKRLQGFRNAYVEYDTADGGTILVDVGSEEETSETGVVKAGLTDKAEKEDGLFDYSGGPRIYFSEYEEWMGSEKAAMEHVCGRVLDIGCGAGRHSLSLQNQGFEVVAIENSPLAIKVCKTRVPNGA